MPVQYAQKRLGGEILDSNGRILNKENFSEEIKEAVSELKDAGFEPGTSKALRTF